MFVFPGLTYVRTVHTYGIRAKQIGQSTTFLQEFGYESQQPVCTVRRTVGTVRLTALATSSWRQKSTK